MTVLVGDRVRARREELGLTREQVAERMRCSPFAIEWLEDGRSRSMGRSFGLRLAVALELRPEELRGEPRRDLAGLPPRPADGPDPLLEASHDFLVAELRRLGRELDEARWQIERMEVEREDRLWITSHLVYLAEFGVKAAGDMFRRTYGDPDDVDHAHGVWDKSEEHLWAKSLPAEPPPSPPREPRPRRGARRG